MVNDIQKIEEKIKELILNDEIMSAETKKNKLESIKQLCIELKNNIKVGITDGSNFSIDSLADFETAHHLITIFTLIDVKHYQYLELLLEGLNTLDDFYC